MVCIYLYFMKKRILSSVITTLLASHASVSFANDKNIERLTVSASPFEQKLSDTANSVFIVSAKDLEIQKAVARNLSEIISNVVPGFSPSTETMSTFGQNFRGGKAIVMIDGVLVSTTLRAGGRDLQSISVDAIESIEVIKGASALYGNGEAGAIINVITKKASSEISFTTRVGAEAFMDELSDTGYSFSQTISGRSKSDVGFLINLAGKDRGNLYDANGDRLPGAPNSQGGMGNADEYDVLVKLDKEFEDSSFAFLAHHYNIENKLQYARIVNHENGLVAIDTSKPFEGTNPGTKLTTVQFTYQHQDLFGQELSLSAYKSKVDIDYEAGSRITSERAGIKAALQWRINELSRLVYGVEFATDNTEQASQRDVITGTDSAGNNILVSQKVCSICDITETKLSPFVQYWQQVTDQLTIQAGLRYENFDIEVPDYNRYMRKTKTLVAKEGDTIDFDKPLINFGLVYSLSDSSELFASYSQGYSHGDMRMLRDMPVDTVAEFADEIPATSTKYYETGVRFNDNALRASVAVFYSDVKDGYAYDYNVKANNGKKVAGMIVADENIWGYELTIDYDINEQLTFGGAISQSEGQRRNELTDTEYWMNSAKITPVKVSAYANYQFNENGAIRLQANYVGDRDKLSPRGEDGYNFYESPYDGYTLVDLVANLDTEFGHFSFGVDNLLNEDYQPLVSQMNKEVYLPAYRYQFSGYGRRVVLEYSVNY